MSVTTPAVALAPKALYKTTISDDTPTLNEFVKFGILVVRPDIAIWSFCENVCVVAINPLTCVAESLVNTTSS